MRNMHGSCGIMRRNGLVLDKYNVTERYWSSRIKGHIVFLILADIMRQIISLTKIMRLTLTVTLFLTLTQTITLTLTLITIMMSRNGRGIYGIKRQNNLEWFEYNEMAWAWS